MARRKTTVHIDEELLKAAKIAAARSGKREYQIFDDDDLVALAREAGAHFLVSGDRHLTALQDPKLQVRTAKQFLALIEAHL